MSTENVASVGDGPLKKPEACLGTTSDMAVVVLRCWTVDDPPGFAVDATAYGEGFARELATMCVESIDDGYSGCGSDNSDPPPPSTKALLDEASRWIAARQKDGRETDPIWIALVNSARREWGMDKEA